MVSVSVSVSVAAEAARTEPGRAHQAEFAVGHRDAGTAAIALVVVAGSPLCADRVPADGMIRSRVLCAGWSGGATAAFARVKVA